MQRMHFKIERFFLNKTRAVAYLAIVFGIGGLFFQPGCGSQKVLPPPQQRQHIQEIFHFYLVHKMRNQSTFPTDAEALKTWAVAQSDTEKEMFVRMGIGGKEESAFISPRDQQPYLVQKIPTGDPMFGAVVALEQEGVDGKRFVVFDSGRAEEIEEQQIKSWMKKSKSKK